MANSIAPHLLEMFHAGLDAVGQIFQHPGSATQFTAIIEPLPPIDPRFDLGNDPRERACVFGLRDEVPDMLMGDRLVQISGTWFTPDTQPQVWEITKRIDNPASIEIRYWVIKHTASDAF